MKRVRVDGQVARSEYHIDDEYDARDEFQPGTFARATPGTLAGRRQLKAIKLDRTAEFARHLKALNCSFLSWFKGELSKNPSGNLDEGVQDCIDYITSLKDRYLRDHGEVLTFGSGDCGQLAHGMDNDDDLMVRFPRVVYSLRNRKVCMVACGGLHNAVVTESGQVWTWGCSDDGSLGRPGEETEPLQVGGGLTDESVIGVACGDGQTIAVTATGAVFGWGSYKDKEGKKWFNPESGSKAIKRQCDLPLCIEGLTGVVEVACGGVFSLAMSDDGHCYSWGLGESGELGRPVCVLRPDGDDFDQPGILRDHLTPSRMQLCDAAGHQRDVSFVKAIGAGAYHSLVVVGNGCKHTDGGLFSCGLNNYGQLGLGDESNRVILERVVDLDDTTVTACKGGVHHSLVACSDGRIFAFGRADSGQLGLARLSVANGGKAGDFSNRPEEVSLSSGTSNGSSSSSAGAGRRDRPVLRTAGIACGGNHSLALTSEGDVYSWGYGDMMALGHGEEADEPVPKKLNFKSAKLERIQVRAKYSQYTRTRSFSLYSLCPLHLLTFSSLPAFL
jgi:regulator of chromosome condensation